MDFQRPSSSDDETSASHGKFCSQLTLINSRLEMLSQQVGQCLERLGGCSTMPQARPPLQLPRPPLHEAMAPPPEFGHLQDQLTARSTQDALPSPRTPRQPNQQVRRPFSQQLHPDDGAKLSASVSSLALQFASEKPLPPMQRGISPSWTPSAPQPILRDRIRGDETCATDSRGEGGCVDQLEAITISRGSSASIIARLFRPALARPNTNSSQGLPSLTRQFSPILNELTVMFGSERARPKWAVAVWDALENPTSSMSAAVYAWLMPKVIIASVVINLAEAVGEEERLSPVSGWEAAVLQICLDSIFAAELLVRFCVCPNQFLFVFDAFNALDAIAVSSLFVRCSMGFVLARGATIRHGFGYFWLFCVVPVLRLLKTLRHFEHFVLLLTAFKMALEALPVLLFVFLLITLSFSGIIYAVEDQSNISSLPEAVWMVIVTMTTVGYGDKVPQTTAGTMIIAVLIISSVLYMAIPLGMIGFTFTDVWVDRQRILLTKKLYSGLSRCGHTATEIPSLFARYDADGSGELDLDEFKELLVELRIVLQDEQSVTLFEALGAGECISAKRFVRELFPHAYHDVFGSKAARKGLKETIQSRFSISTTASKKSKGVSETDVNPGSVSVLGPA